MLEKLEVVRQILHGFDYTSFFKAEVKDKLSIILRAEDFILSTDETLLCLETKQWFPEMWQ